MSDLAALGAAGGAGGVDDRGQVGCVPDRPALLGLLVGHSPDAIGGDRGDVIDQPELLQAGKPIADAADHLGVPGRLSEDRRGTGVTEYPFHLLGR